MYELHDYPITKHVTAFERKAALAYPSLVKSGVFVQAPAEKGFLGLSFLTGMAICKTAIAPIERVKLLMQNEGAMIKTEPYKGIRNCFWRTVMDEGFGSLWRGSTANVIRYVPYQAMNFAIHDVLKHRLNVEGSGYWWWSAGNLAAGFYAGGLSHLIVYPVEYARTRLALDVNKGGERQFKGVVDVWKKTLASHGNVGLKHGFMASLIGASGYRSFYFGMYDSLKPVVLTGTMQDSFYGSFALAWAAATVAGFITYPVDTIGRRIMMKSGEYNSIYLNAFKDPRSLFKGGGANILRAAAGAAVLAAYDKLKPFGHYGAVHTNFDECKDSDGELEAASNPVFNPEVI
ncbi:ADP,ATP carrier protein-like isoform X2 [Salvia miltiorrhiza]|uniref:ADP,ATP carrier protein-like isoform X2 n=1 Tax=Salvia miltiorrhiza TaxID=226208 RepID=UPI0025AB8319|nr:ADP,ATP carrier protein-like isoform X2 [Salvia miltiorrhiza]